MIKVVLYSIKGETIEIGISLDFILNQIVIYSAVKERNDGT